MEIYSKHSLRLRRKHQQGQSFFEVIIAIAIISIVLISLTGAGAVSIAASVFSRNQNLATRYSQQASEWLRQEKSSSWSVFKTHAATSVYCLDQLWWTNSGACTAAEIISGTIFTRSVTFTVVDANTVQAVVATAWKDGKGLHNATTTTIFTSELSFVVAPSASSIPTPTPSPPPTPTPPPGPIAWWKYDECTGTTINDSVGANTGALTIGATGAQTAAGTCETSGAWFNGRIGINGASMNFDGADDSTSFGTTFGNFAVAQPFSVSLWINDALINSANHGVISRMNASSVGWQIRVTTSNTVRFILASSGANFRGSDTAVLTAGWHHIVGVWDGTSATTYLDGALSATPLSGGTLGTITSSQTLFTAFDASTNSFFSGKLDDVRVYNYALSAAQVSTIFTTSGPTSIPPSVAWWKIDECSGTTIGDSIGTNNATLSIGAGGTQTTVGTCATSGAWFNGAIGMSNASMNFDGTDDGIQAPSSAILRPAIVSVSAWVKFAEASTTFRTIVSNRATNAAFKGYLIGKGAAGTQKINFLVTTNGTSWGALLSSDANYVTGKWYHVVGTFTSGSAILYVDGVAQTQTSALAGSVNYGTDNLRIGADSNGSVFSGQIDDVRVFNYALSPAQVLYLYNNPGAP